MTLITSPSIDQTSASLGRVARLWLDPANAWRQEAVTAIQVSSGLSHAKVEAALAAAFEELSEDKISAYLSRESVFQRSFSAPEKVLHVLAGNVFTAFLPGAVITLLLGAECHLKPSVQEPVFAALWQRSLEQIDPSLGKRVRIVRWEDNLLSRYPAVVAYGSDGTLNTLRALCVPGTRFIEYGHKMSVAILWREALTPDALPALLQRLEQDAAPFDLAGCLSPQKVYVEGEDAGLFEKLFARLNVMPQIKRFETWEELKEELADDRPFLSALGYAGSESRTAALLPEFMALGFSRVCALGEMQRPPLDWRNGGFSLAEALTRP